MANIIQQVKASKFELALRWCNSMILDQIIRPESILWFSCVLKIDPAEVSHNLDFIFRNIIVETFHHGENISNIGLKT